MNKLERVEEMERQLESTTVQLVALKAEIEADQKAEVWEPKTGVWLVGLDYSVKGSGHARYGRSAQTKERANQRRIMLNTAAIIDCYVEEHAPDWVADWSHGSRDKHTVARLDGEWFLHSITIRMLGVAVGPESVMRKLAADINSGRVVLPS